MNRTVKKKTEKKNPLVRVWCGTPVHASLDTRLHMRLVELLKANGIDSRWEGDFSILDVCKNKKALVTHQARGGYRYPYTPAQTDAEAIILDMYSGKLPSGIKLYVTAHKHTTDGTIEHKGLKVIRCPAFVTFIAYAQSLTMLPHYQPDIGAWIIIVTKDGRIRTQEWLYPSFLYNEANQIIYSNEDAEKSYVNSESKQIQEPLITLLKQAVKVILVLADTHVGELGAVCPNSFHDINGVEQEIKTTIANKKLLEYWNHLCYITKTFFKPDEIWLVGDVFAGQMSIRFEKFRKITLGNLDDQTYAALELIRELLP